MNSAEMNGLSGAFPLAGNPRTPVTQAPDGEVFDYEQYGLTKRELFAALAMQAQIACTSTEDLTGVAVALNAVQYADALIAELAKEARSEVPRDYTKPRSDLITAAQNLLDHIHDNLTHEAQRSIAEATERLRYVLEPEKESKP